MPSSRPKYKIYRTIDSSAVAMSTSEEKTSKKLFNTARLTLRRSLTKPPKLWTASFRSYEVIFPKAFSTICYQKGPN